MDDAAAHSYLQLALRLGYRTRGLGDALRAGVAPPDLLAARPAALASLPPATAAALSTARTVPAQAVGEFAARLSDCGAQLLPIHDALYPDPLRSIPDPPPWLFCRGDPAALSAPLVAVVGSRRASHAGLRLAGQLARQLADGGYAICSGLALGIDAAAHHGALAGGSTVAVLATGIDAIYPRRHARLALDIEQAGCLVSELPPGSPPQRGQFPRRNRIISGLATATVIVEAALPSGSLHTAAAALEQGRDVYVLPWSILHAGGAGCLYLLRDGAIPLTSLDELEDHFPRLSAAAPGADPVEERLLGLIGDGAPTLGALAQASGLDSSDLLALLGGLEAAGRVRREDGGYARVYCKPCQWAGS